MAFDPRYAPAYTPRQAARYLRVPVATVRAWAVGQPYGQGRKGFFKAVIEPQQGDSGLAFSFVNLVELHVLAALRRVHGLPLHKVRASIEYLAKQYPRVKHPLADLDLLTDGLDIWLKELEAVVAVSDQGQLGIRAAVESHLRRVERGPHGAAIRLFPFTRPAEAADEPRAIVIDPQFAFGHPILARAGVPTRAIVQRFDDGDTVEQLATDYELPREEIEEAIRWERLAA